MPILDGPTPEEIKEEETNRLQSLHRARAILGSYYLLLPFILIYILFKVFPPNPWWPPDYRSVQLVFFTPRLNIWTTLEERLILLVAAAGALGSYIHSATSYADYRGNRQFGPSWLLWYMLRPLVGVCLALVVYFALRGGLLSMVISGDTANDANNINPFGIAAIAGLTGMFSKQAADKLAEVFTTLFKSQGDQLRRDSLAPAPAPEIKAIAPTEGPAVGGTPITITGTGFIKDAEVSFGESSATKVVFVDATTLTADTPAGQGVVDVTVVNPDGQKVTLVKGFTYSPAAGGTDGVATEVGAIADTEDVIDGCDVEIVDETPDEELPRTEGGVA